MTKKLREIVLDVETTGLYHNQGDRIIEVGCVELRNHVPTGNNLQFYCKRITSVVAFAASRLH